MVVITHNSTSKKMAAGRMAVGDRFVVGAVVSYSLYFDPGDNS